MAEERIAGTLAAAVTPLREGGERLDEEALGALLGFYQATGIDGVLILGTTGEGVLLDHDERCRVAERAVAEARDIRVLVHCGAQTTRATRALAAHAAEAGADGVAVIAPPYFRFAMDELVEHFAAAGRASAPLPFYVYEYAERSGYAIPLEAIEWLQDRLPNLVGIKVSDAPFERVKPYLATGLDVFIGAEELIPEGLEGGAAGAVSGVAAAFPEAVAALVREPTDAQTAHVAALRAALSVHPFQASVKAALGLRGLPVHPDVRAPLRPLSATAVEDLRHRLEELAVVEAR
jgi:dihydrodipicolinate synthase/N-acetylneuraminate lyase